LIRFIQIKLIILVWIINTNSTDEDDGN